MKIIIGKFSNELFHALSQRELNLLFKLIPKEWAVHVSSIVLSSKVFKKTKLSKPIEYSAATKRLSIYSRGLVRENIARQLLLELALINAEHGEKGAVVDKDFDSVIKPYMDKFLKARV